MTNIEYLQAITKKFNFSDTDIDILFEENKNILPDDNCNVIGIKKMLVNYFAYMLPLHNVSEGGYSITWNMDAVKLWYALTCRELGIAPVGISPTVKNVEVW